MLASARTGVYNLPKPQHVIHLDPRSEHSMTTTDRRLIAASLGCFILAALSGAFFRFGMGTGTTANLSLENIRHAHSHLMYFSWATPALCVLLLPANKRGALWIWTMLGAGLLSYPLFLFFGYDPVTFGGVTLPPSVIVSGMIMLAWYGWIFEYIRETRDLRAENGKRPLGQSLIQLALIFLVISSLAAWGISASVPLGMVTERSLEGFKHAFLSYFTEGWLTLAAVAVASKFLPNASQPSKNELGLITGLLAIGISLSFILGMPSRLLNPSLMLLARSGAFLSGVGLLLVARHLWRNAEGWWRVPVSALALKGLALATLAPFVSIWWADNHQDRVLFLHLLLLGIVTLSIVLALEHKPSRLTKLFVVACVLLIGLLVPPSTLWVLPNVGFIWNNLIVPFSTLPVLIAIVMLLRWIRSS